jgi:hypothetical protein
LLLITFGTSFAAVAKPGLTPASPFAYGTQLYVGATPGCNAGVVTTNTYHLRCNTTVVGYAIDRESTLANPAGFVEIYVGIEQNKNAGVVTSSINHLNGRTRSIGFLSIEPFDGGVRLYRGVTPGCNAGVISTGPSHMGCSSRLMGYAIPR